MPFLHAKVLHYVMIYCIILFKYLDYCWPLAIKFGGACGIMLVIIGNGNANLSSTLRCGCLLFPL